MESIEITEADRKAYAVLLEFLEDEKGQVYCPTCGSYDLEQFGIDGFWCNECNLRIS